MDNRGSGLYQVSLDISPEERGPFDGVLEGEELQAGITETTEVSPPKSMSHLGSMTHAQHLWAVTNGSRPGLAVVSLHFLQEF